MERKIIKIDQEKCNGCGLCANACHEGAIALQDGKAVLVRDDYCDGLGNCLPVCPTGAISFEVREAAAYDEAAVKANAPAKTPAPYEGGCPGTHSRVLHAAPVPISSAVQVPMPSRLGQWPCQIQLVSLHAPYFENAHLLIAADCTAFAYGNIHEKFMKDKITIIGCPKLDEVDYAQKLTAILQNNNIKSITVLRMEVPCCGGIVRAVTTALQNSQKWIPWHVVTISTDGKILEEA